MSPSAAMQDQHWQDVLFGPVSTVPEFAPIGQLLLYMLQTQPLHALVFMKLF